MRVSGWIFKRVPIKVHADVMKCIAAPMICGLITSFLLELLVYPAIYKLWKAQVEPVPAPR
jgi:Cu(I)/Ag(I) efflux system membrane protein CusA/SilA